VADVVGAFSRSFHHELASKGIRVHAVLPSGIVTRKWGTDDTPIELLSRRMVMLVTGMVDAALMGSISVRL
jgi:short-subunit dehydrogenase